MSEEGDGRVGSAPSVRFRFPRRGRLKRRLYLRALFDRSRGDVFSAGIGGIRILARLVERDAVERGMPVQVGFSAGRRRTAVERNRIRRIMRESYRVHQHPLLGLFEGSDRVLTVMVLYRGHADDPADSIPRDLPRALERLCVAYRDRTDRPARPVE